MDKKYIFPVAAITGSALVFWVLWRWKKSQALPSSAPPSVPGFVPPLPIYDPLYYQNMNQVAPQATNPLNQGIEFTVDTASKIVRGAALPFQIGYEKITEGGDRSYG